MSTGIGGDAFALIWMANEKKVHALNASGRAPKAASIAELKNKGITQITRDSIYSVSVPGAVHGWEKVIKRFGTLSLSEVLKPAIQYARDGYPVSDIISHYWSRGMAKLSRYPSGKEMMLNGRAPKAGDIMRLPELANSLQSIADGGADAFYKGPIARKIAAFIQQQGGWMTEDDIAADEATWDEAICTDYHGVTVWECPPNGQGIAALIALNIAEGFDIKKMGLQSPEAYHHLIESMRLAFADAHQYVADPRKAPVPIKDLLSRGYAVRRRSLISSERAMSKAHYGEPTKSSDTVYLTCVDGKGNACSFINSLFEGFGVGLVVPGTGIALQNRASLFSLDPNHLNALAPGKRPYQTIIPAMATRGGEMWLSFGVMGGFQQPQGHLQVIVNMVDFNMEPQAALNALRFSIRGEDDVALEEGVSEAVVKSLKAKGHKVSIVVGYDRTMFGGGQVIERDPETGVLKGGSEPRKDGCAVGW
jgi:gamma-glutamyltranspeptidase/glutathione hydrolase